LWKDLFQFPTDEPCIESGFGELRLYNNTLTTAHTGLDLGVCANNLNVYAAAPGTVVYTGLLTIRGNATIVDEGWGVYNLYFHQKQILVKVGDKVAAKQIIGVIGDTGRVTGPHLHWEVRVNNVPVYPADWTTNVYP
jgi:murein DD-endopeptidase MepM/ murein hydrolase activator NlpD